MWFLCLVCREESSLVCVSIKKWTGNQCEQNKFTSGVDGTESPGGWGESQYFSTGQKSGVWFCFASAPAFVMLNWLSSHLIFWNATPVLEQQHRRTTSLYSDWWYLEQLQSYGQPASGLPHEIIVLYWYWIFEKISISGTDSQILTAKSVDQWVWFPFDYLVDHDFLPEEHSPFSWLARHSSPLVDRWCSKAATNLCRLFFEFLLNHDSNVDFDTCRSEQMLFGKEVACHV